MGSPLSPVIANFYTEDYEKAALESAPLTARCWFRYVDDTFVVWPHDPDKIKDSLHDLNSIHQSIKFTMEKESEGHLAFFDLDIYRRPEGCLGHKAYRKPIHTNLYLSAKSHQQPSYKQVVLSTRIHLSVTNLACRPKDVFIQNGYNDRHINRALNRRPHLPQPGN
jgi:hypothetical protein